MIPKHAYRPDDPASHARCECQRLVYCPRHHAPAYALFEATHRGESVEVADCEICSVVRRAEAVARFYLGESA